MGVAFASISEGYPFFDRFVNGVRDAVGNDCLLQFFEQPVGNGNDDEQASRIPLEQVSGLIMMMPINFDLAARCRRSHVPVVMLHPGLPSGDNCNVVVDYQAGMTDAMLHLHSRERRKIAFISPGPHLVSTLQEVSAYHTGLRWLGMDTPKQWMIHAGHDELSGYEATKRLLAGDQMPDAIIYGSDFAAKGGLHALHEARLNVPKDIAIIGMGNALRPMETAIELTTVDTKVFEEGRTAASVLTQLVEGVEGVQMEHVIKPQLIIKQST